MVCEVSVSCLLVPGVGVKEKWPGGREKRKGGKKGWTTEVSGVAPPSLSSFLPRQDADTHINATRKRSINTIMLHIATEMIAAHCLDTP